MPKVSESSDILAHAQGKAGLCGNSAKNMLISISVLWCGVRQSFHFPAFGGILSLSLVAAIKKKMEQLELS